MSSQGNLRRLRKDTDYISKLPDTILCYILSFLSTKLVIRTSILSKRWKYLWTKVPALDFAHYSDEFDREIKSTIDYSRLRSFVERVLFHNNVSYLQRFCLHLCDADDFYVNSWLTDVSRRQICEIDINLEWNSINLMWNPTLRIPLPSSLISQEKLVILKLEGRIIVNDLNISQFPNLETVRLKNLKFLDHVFLMRICISPKLKELYIDRCAGLPKVLYIVSLTLKSLTLKPDTKWVDSSCFSYFVIKTPNINYVHLYGTLSQYDIGETCSLIEARLDLAYDDDDDNDSRAQELLRKVSSVNILHLEDEVFFNEKKLPFFKKLTYLRQDADQTMCERLKCAPKLKSLVINSFNYDFPLELLLAPEHLPFLETIEVSLFQGEDEEFDMIAYFLKAASALKEMKIKALLNNESRTDAYERLLNMPRSSSVCQVYMARFSSF